MPLKRQLGEGLHFKHLEHLEPPQPLQARREPPCWRRQEVTFRGRVPQRPPTPLSETALRRGHAARPSVTSAGTGAPGRVGAEAAGAPLPDAASDVPRVGGRQQRGAARRAARRPGVRPAGRPTPGSGRPDAGGATGPRRAAGGAHAGVGNLRPRNAGLRKKGGVRRQARHRRAGPESRGRDRCLNGRLSPARPGALALPSSLLGPVGVAGIHQTRVSPPPP